MQYYDLKKNWQKVKRRLGNEKVIKTLVRDFNKFTYGKWRKEFKAGMLPRDFESCDWDWEYKGRRPHYWQYVKHSACHWLVNFNLEVAKLAVPAEPWRIITSDKHSTVWNGLDLLFDFNFLALGVEPDRCFELANKKELPIGKQKRCYMVEYWKDEEERKTGKRPDWD